jgi:hypothetical protein
LRPSDFGELHANSALLSLLAPVDALLASFPAVQLTY